MFGLLRQWKYISVVFDGQHRTSTWIPAHEFESQTNSADNTMQRLILKDKGAENRQYTESEQEYTDKNEEIDDSTSKYNKDIIRDDTELEEINIEELDGDDVEDTTQNIDDKLEEILKVKKTKEWKDLKWNYTAAYNEDDDEYEANNDTIDEEYDDDEDTEKKSEADDENDDAVDENEPDNDNDGGHKNEDNNKNNDDDGNNNNDDNNHNNGLNNDSEDDATKDTADNDDYDNKELDEDEMEVSEEDDDAKAQDIVNAIVEGVRTDKSQQKTTVGYEKEEEEDTEGKKIR